MEKKTKIFFIAALGCLGLSVLSVLISMIVCIANIGFDFIMPILFLLLRLPLFVLAIIPILVLKSSSKKDKIGGDVFVVIYSIIDAINVVFLKVIGALLLLMASDSIFAEGSAMSDIIAVQCYLTDVADKALPIKFLTINTVFMVLSLIACAIAAIMSIAGKKKKA